MSNVLFFLLGIVSFFAYLFFLWKYLHEDYETNSIFTYGITTFAALIVSLVVGNRFGNFWFWSAFVGYSVTSLVLARKFNFRIIEVIEASTPGYLIMYLTIFILGLIEGEGSGTLVIFFITLILIAGFFVLKKHYKRFTWYKSGKLGFASMTTLGILFLTRAVTSLVAGNVTSHIGVIGFIPSAILSFFSFFTLYNLSEKR